MVSPIYRVPDRLSDLPEVTQWVKGGAGVWLQNLYVFIIFIPSSENTKGVQAKAALRSQWEGVNGSIFKGEDMEAQGSSAPAGAAVGSSERSSVRPESC